MGRQLPATWFEELLALCLDDPELPDMRLQYPIRNSSGTIVARADIAFPSIRLGLEAHSREFHFGADAEELDEDRETSPLHCAAGNSPTSVVRDEASRGGASHREAPDRRPRRHAA